MSIGTVDSGSPGPDEPVGDAPDPAAPEAKVWTPRRRAWRRLRRNVPALLAIAWIVVLLFLTAFASLIATHDPADLVARPFEGPSGDHLLGTDDLGRDVFSRLVYGVRPTVQAGFQTAAMALVIAVPLGLVAGYLGGKVDLVLLRIMDAMRSFPPLVLALALAAVLGPGLGNAIIAITVVLIPGLVRIVRGQSLAIREEVYIEASRSIGVPLPRMLWSRIFPGVLSPLIVSTAILVGGAMLAEASLSFLGLGIQAPQPSWGNMLQRSFGYIYVEPQLILWPGMAIALSVLSFNLLGDGLRDAFGISEEAPARGTKRGRMGLTTVADQDRAVGRESQDRAGSLLSVRNLSVEFQTPDGPVTVVSGVDLDIAPGEVLGLVGESGSGKSVTSSAIMRLIPSPPGRVASGSVRLSGRELTSLSFEEMRKIRGNEMAMIFQDPMSSLDPAFTVGFQMIEAIRLHRNMSKAAARTRAVSLLEMVGIPEPVLRMDDYPHQMSGGMRQRVLIAMALINEPRLLIADEPTTALDVTVQAQIIELLKELQSSMQMGMLFVTHDMGVIANIADRVAVMYAGQIVEQGPVEVVFETPSHPYTRALLSAIPQIVGGDERLASIPGVVPTPDRFPDSCRFADRCAFATDACRSAQIPMFSVSSVHRTRCIRHEELDE